VQKRGVIEVGVSVTSAHSRVYLT